MTVGSITAAVQPYQKHRGGTFTDVFAAVPGRKDIVLELLSVDPSSCDDAPAEGIRLVPETVSGKYSGLLRTSQLNIDIVVQKLEELTVQINADTRRSMTSLEVAHGFIDVANESMSRHIRALTEAKGFETQQHALATFGGAGVQHACEIAKKLGIKRIVIHKYSSILSAYGMALAEVIQETQEPSSEILSEEFLSQLTARMQGLKTKATEGLLAQ
ncbi:Hydantoinase/oxoprolinase-domain-containing protein [Daldinia caldariorum]|uniref:Hydantoinase/oxoprolinase-domain-containing protein n=1 Tax=Daldinia caldariorum TaxID=326644 RepID=UPI0020080F8B|nr:Hydantoinase/oxoprolinase-domain-containing protein [Daldinia caldariorum]KAI1464265.1 Hydantoinase/oxoprolinase-domain-containing protein [Daldinia caldariorum]